MLTKNLQKDCSVWLFQCNPEKYRIEAALNDAQINHCFHWLVKQHKQDITKGDTALIWCSGQSAGIFAIAEILTNPELQVETKYESEYWIDDTGERGTQTRVKLKLETNLSDTPVHKKTMLQIQGLQQMRIFKMPRGTNFRVSQDEWKIIQGLIQDRKGDR